MPAKKKTFTSVLQKSVKLSAVFRTTVGLVALLKACNPAFVYDPSLRPVRTLTEVGEGETDGFDNLEGDLIL